jgi:glycosidase
LEGGKDPECRGAFPWDPADWKADLHSWVQNLISIRKARPSLRRGEYSRVIVDETTGIYAFARTLGEEKTLIVWNTSTRQKEFTISVQEFWSDGHTIRSLIDHRPLSVHRGKISIKLPGCSGQWLG